MVCCKICGNESSSSVSDCIRLTCAACGDSVYHQECVDKYVKSFRLKGRTVGYACPCSKTDACKGRISRVHAMPKRNASKKEARIRNAIVAARTPPKKPVPNPPKPKSKPIAVEVAESALAGAEDGLCEVSPEASCLVSPEASWECLCDISEDGDDFRELMRVLLPPHAYPCASW